MPMTRDEGIAAITVLVGECLALKPETISPSCRLLNDLGASSLDFIDLIFMLERRFGVQVQEVEFEFLKKVDATAPDALGQGAIPPETLERLRQWLPALAAVPDPTAVTAAQLLSMVTVETLWLLVESKMAPA